MDMFRICAVGQQANSISHMPLCHCHGNHPHQGCTLFWKEYDLEAYVSMCCVIYFTTSHFSLNIRKCLFTLFIFDFFLHL